MQESIRVGQLIALTEPTLTLSTSPDASLKAQQDIKATTTYREEFKSYTYRSNNLKYNQTSVRSIIMQKFITGEMEEKLRNEVDFETTLKDPIEMLNRIKKFMNQSEDGKYDIWNFFQEQQKFFSMRQSQEESLFAWKSRFKNQGEQLKARAGKDLFTEFIKTTKIHRNLADNPALNQAAMDEMEA